METIEKILNLIKRYERFLIVIHQFPDGDTLATSLGLAMALKKINKYVLCVCKDVIPLPFQFLPNTKDIKSDFLVGDFDVVVVIDCGDLKRTGFPDRLKQFARYKKRLINIDHHPKNDLHKIANHNLIDHEAAAASEIVYHLLRLLHISLDKNIATCFLTALYTDTGGFKHSNTTPRSLENAAIWMAAGARLKLITKNVSLNRSVAALKLWGIALSRVHKNSMGLVASFVTQQDLLDNGANENDLGGIVNLINSIPGVKAAILLSETADGHIKASLRTESDRIDVSRLAMLLGGGGHRKASGFIIPGRLKERSTGQWVIA